MMMASSQRPPRKTVSRCEPETDRCTHVLEIAAYSLHKDVEPNEFIQSATFAVCGHDWCIQFFPNGQGFDLEDTEGLEHPVSLFLEILSTTADKKVRALYDFRLVNVAGMSISVCSDDRVLFISECAYN